MTRKTTKAQAAAAAFEVLQDVVPETAAKRTRRTRQPVKALNKTPEVVAANAKADAERKKASRKALAQHLIQTAKQQVREAKRAEKVKSEEQRAAERAAYIEALRVDAAALGVDADTYIAEQLRESRGGYTGPMLALRRAVVKYVKAANGQPCCGDDLAQICGAFDRETVVAGLLVALQLEGNPYAHLNPGQQSMNLRNKARAALKNGSISTEQIRHALQSV